ncbi:MAG: hypothetical protein KIS87_05590 [Phycisphaeraceae bacterium]|nr:hypothetical protein [Phycisphaeraceae bacterium]
MAKQRARKARTDARVGGDTCGMTGPADAAESDLRSGSQDDRSDPIEAFILAVSTYLQWRHLGRLKRYPECTPGSEAAAATLAEIRADHEREMDAKEAVRLAGERLVPALAKAGHDSTGVTKLLHYIVEGGGPDRAFQVWAEVKADLRQIQCGMQGTPAGLLFAYLASAGSVFPEYIAFLSDDPASVDAARGRIQHLVKVELGPLRTRAEDGASEASRPRVREALAEVEKAAWELMHALDGHKRSDLIRNRRLIRGPWMQPMDRLRAAIDRAYWLVRDDPRLLGNEHSHAPDGEPFEASRAVSLNKAATEWFEMDYRSLKDMVEAGTIRAQKRSARKWSFHLPSVPAAKRDKAR